MLYRGTIFPDVPDDAVVVTTRAFLLIGAAPFAKAYLQRNSIGGSTNFFLGTDFGRPFGADVDWEARLLAFTLGVHVVETVPSASLPGGCHGGVELDPVTDAGAVVGGSQVNLGSKMFYGTTTATDELIPAESVVANPEPHLFPLPVQSHGLTFPRLSRVRVFIQTEPGSLVPANSMARAVAAFALYPILTPEQKGAGA